LTTRIIHDGTLVITVVEVSLSDKSTNAGDLFLHVFKDSTVKVSSSTGSFISSAGLSGFVIGEVDEEPQERGRGRVSVRNHGKQHGEFYFYRSDRSISSSHTMIGEVSKGMEIIDLAESGDEFAIITRPKLVNCIGMTQSNARDQLAELGHRQIRKGDESDGALIVYHHPSSTLMMRPGGPVETTGVPPEHVIRLRLFDEAAPVTAKYLRDVSGLTLARIGRLKVEQAYSPLIGAMLLNGDHSRISVPDLNSENVPIEKIGVGVIGVTNSVVERMGIIGIRMNESDEFGPTLEHFESSNIVGQIEGEIDALKRFKNGNDLYVMEAEPMDFPSGPKR
jgi:putative methanogenesis marker protein 3